MIYLKKFETTAEYDVYIEGDSKVLPNVSICEDDTSTIYYNPYVEIQPNNEIWYTSTDGNIVELYTGYTGPNPISNTYTNEKGVMEFKDDMTSIVNFAFLKCSSLASITIPEGVTSIGESAFWYCRSLTSIILPESVTSIGIKAFSSCSSLTSITIPEGVTSIGKYAFSGCSSLTSINIPSGVTSIVEYTFTGCSSLISITIPEGVTSIGRDAFFGCSSLASITIPEGVTSIGDAAFRACSSLASITFEGTKSQWNAISKGVMWDYQVPATYVQCTDGSAPL